MRQPLQKRIGTMQANNMPQLKELVQYFLLYHCEWQWRESLFSKKKYIFFNFIYFVLRFRHITAMVTSSKPQQRKQDTCMFDKIEFLNTGYIWQTKSSVENSDTVWSGTGLSSIDSFVTSYCRKEECQCCKYY